MQSIRYNFDREIPVLHEADVMVVGGGPGGLGAAVMAARCGASTLLIERYGFLGGMASGGEVQPFTTNHARGRCLDRPVYLEWVERMRAYLPEERRARTPSSGEASEYAERIISKDIAMLAAEDLCLAAGVRLLYHHHLADALTQEGRIAELILFSKSGFTAARAGVYVDCTGDADLAACAGCEFEQGGPSGHCQPMTLCFKLNGVDRAAMPDGETITRLYREARDRGEIRCPREDVLWFAWLEEPVIHFNTTRVIHRSGTSGADLSEAEIEGRRQLRQYLEFLRRRVPGFAAAEIHSIAHHIGVRETRRVKGRVYLTRAAFESRARYPDAIAKVCYPIDIHNPDGFGTEMRSLSDGEWYEIPYGCVVAKDVSNLLIGGRPISVDHAIHSSMRVMPSACSVGQAAGLAAAVAAQRGISPADLEGVEVRRLLAEKGARL